MSEVLDDGQVGFYRDNGYLVLESRVPERLIEDIRSEIAGFYAEARGLTESNDRLDLEDSHRPDEPRIRRIKLPHAISPAVNALMRSDWILAPVRDLVGPGLRLHTSKLNMKSAQYGAAVEWHQDWAFYPHTNDDILAVGVMIDDMALENGPLMVFPGTHRAGVYDHNANGRFCGAMDLAACGLDPADAVALTGPAGSISLHHVRLVHGSALNTSTRDRRLLLYEITAADAFPIMGGLSQFSNLEEYDQRLLCGPSTTEPRVTDVPVRLPLPRPERSGSIYEMQKGLAARAFGHVQAST